jgi:hypothetical protein
MSTSSVRAEELARPAVHLLARDLLDSLADHPLLAEWVAQAPGAVAVELVLKWIDDFGSGGNRALPGGVDVLPVGGP